VTTNAEDQRLGKETTVSKWIGMTIAPAVTGRSLLESPSTQVRSLEGRLLGMSSSLMLPECSRLRLLEQRPSDSRPHELQEQGQNEREHGWVAASEEIVMAPSKEGFEERKRAGSV
jgi:hypothetical protein